MSSQSKTVQYLCKEEADLRFSFVNISNESKQLFLLRSTPIWSFAISTLRFSKKKKTTLQKNRLKYIMHNSNFSTYLFYTILISPYFFYISKINIMYYVKNIAKYSQSFRKKRKEKRKFDRSSFIRGTKLASSEDFPDRWTDKSKNSWKSVVFSETNATPTYSCARLECKSIEERLASKRQQWFETWYTRVSLLPLPPRYLRTPTLTRSHRTSCLCHQKLLDKTAY